MTYTLYYSPGAASFAVHWMLLEMEATFNAVLVDIETGANRTPGYLRLNPAGRVPTLVVDGRACRESAALLMLLTERHPEMNFAPSPGAPDRAAWLETMLFLANTVLPAMRDWFYADIDGDASGADAVQAIARRRIEDAWARLDALFSDGRTYIVGDQVGAADFLAIMVMRWSRNMPRPATDWPNLATYIQRLRARPAFIAVNQREGLTDWLNG